MEWGNGGYTCSLFCLIGVYILFRLETAPHRRTGRYPVPGSILRKYGVLRGSCIMNHAYGGTSWL